MIAPALSIDATMREAGARAHAAFAALRLSDASTRTHAIVAAAQALRDRRNTILEANDKDVGAARASDAALLDRLRLDEARVEAMAAALDAIAAQPDPVGEEMARWRRPNGLDIARVRAPIGVIAVIYESRPNVTADAGALCLRSANAVILRGGSEATASNAAIHASLVEGLDAAGVPADCIQLTPTSDRAAVGCILAGLDGAVDLVIPRGGKSLVERVRRDARVPTLDHLEGLCHVFVHAGADLEMARAIAVNAKMRRPGVCGAAETLLVDAACAPTHLPAIAEDLVNADCRLLGDDRARAVVPTLEPADDATWATEHLAPVMGVAIVDGLDGALAHIARYGSGHTDAIVTGDDAVAERFLAEVDSAIALHNASTQFADGGEFGFGGEIGIATGRLHARGPVGAEQLTTFSYVVRGDGQTRP